MKGLDPIEAMGFAQRTQSYFHLPPQDQHLQSTANERWLKTGSTNWTIHTKAHRPINSVNKCQSECVNNILSQILLSAFVEETHHCEFQIGYLCILAVHGLSQLLNPVRRQPAAVPHQSSVLLYLALEALDRYLNPLHLLLWTGLAPFYLLASTQSLPLLPFQIL